MKPIIQLKIDLITMEKRHAEMEAEAQANDGQYSKPTQADFNRSERIWINARRLYPGK